MIARIRAEVAREPVMTAAVTIAVAGAATILGALGFQYGLGLQPCPLCLQQRWPYYLTIPLAVLIASAAKRRVPRRVLVGGLLVIALVLLWGAGLGVYHAGVEWGRWTGPQDCAGAGFTPGAGSLIEQIQKSPVVRCDEAPWRFLGLSLAGWNALIALALAAVAVWGLTHRGTASAAA